MSDRQKQAGAQHQDRKGAPTAGNFPCHHLGGKIGPLISPPFSFFALFKYAGVGLPMDVAKDGAIVKGGLVAAEWCSVSFR